MKRERNLFGIPLWILGISAALVCLAGAVLAARYYGTNVETQVEMGIIGGGVLFLPLLLVTSLVQMTLALVCKSRMLRRYAMNPLLLTILPSLVLLASCVYSFGVVPFRDRNGAFATFFSAKPPGGKLVEYGYERAVFGGGSYVLLFKLGQEDLKGLMDREGYTVIGAETDPDHWRLSLCNQVVRALTRGGVEIRSSFACYSRETITNRVRVFYDGNRELGILVGFGQFSHK